ncbi:MAG: hypothetical protein QM695_07840 [Micropruina sp.]
MSESKESNPEVGCVLVHREQADLQATAGQSLVGRVSSLIERARESIASYANATLTMTYWDIGSIIDAEVLGSARAEYGAQILV